MRASIAAAALLLLAACGRKATEADCQLIIDQNVSVQMKAMNINDPAAIAKKQEDLRTELKGETKDCVGRRVTDTMMSCVKGAQTADEITACLR
jgi:hypothetical protein